MAAKALCLLAPFMTSLVAIPQASASEVLQFLTNIAPPYQEMVEGALDGSSMRTVSCVMRRLNQRYEVDLAPWLRAREQVRLGAAQGLFSVAPDFADLANGRLSLPLALERWVWVTMRGPKPARFTLEKDRHVAAVLGSNQLKWLAGQGADATGAARTAVQLLRMLAAGRVDAVLVDEAELHVAWKEAGVDPTSLALTFERYMPLGVYFSNSFLAAHPGFLDRFNQEIAACPSSNMALSPMERRVVLQVAQQIRANLLADPHLVPALLTAGQGSAGLSVPQIIERDRIYRQHRAAMDHLLVQAVRNHPLSSLLAQLLASTHGTVVELQLFDEAGLTLAADPLPSDLWQADEAKFSQTVALGPDSIFIDAISFDESTSQFSVQVSFALPGKEPNRVAGGLTVGLNIEQTLNSHHINPP
ncbi:hypothetical protein GE253_00100 [Niveispirillum sp. SYP-B3756]|uniref:substrate-binding periplasmic protein n=1 Tax=Niveispirillum sp. SYP-B3756 TaxID=2662178 RepID=UPI0012909BDC|nr:hypothetical protein [Niveispirillum sp. SYP-B3756]MQP63737.1 hypothetical protein [Niveispirillum sp. SYP-B3756]